MDLTFWLMLGKNCLLFCLAKVTSPDVVQTREAGDSAQTLGKTYGKDGDAQRSLQLKISHLKGRMRMQHMFGPAMHGDSQHQRDEVV